MVLYIYVSQEVLDWICLTTTRPSGHISHPSQVNECQSCFHAPNKLLVPDHIVRVWGLVEVKKNASYQIKEHGFLCFQFTHFLCDDWENIYTLSYYHHQIGSMNYYPLFRNRSRNNGMRCMCFYILVSIFSGNITRPKRNSFFSRPKHYIELFVEISVLRN